MTSKYIHKIIMIFTIFALAGFGSMALAHMGPGSGSRQGWHHGYGGHHKGYGGPWGNLSEAEIKQMQAQRQAFFEATREIRAQLYQKRLELASELAKKDYDPQKAVNLQREISGLRGQMDLKRLDHIMNLKKINPDVGRGLLGGGRWEFHMMGSGHHMGRGMMGRGHHMGPWGVGGDESQQYHGMQGGKTE